MLREVEVKALVMDPQQQMPVLLLREPQSERVVPVWIGHPEATAIAIVLQNREFPRPLTHDLLRATLKTLGAELEMIVIDSIQDSTYYATLHVRDSQKQSHQIDARPSDAIAIALRTGSPIYISEEIFQIAAVEMPSGEEDSNGKRDKFVNFVEAEMRLAEFKRFAVEP
ncbi:MAG: bifunctional nuclease family protein [Candidatus Bipolaricaulota bacterium]|nr:bifunctional nuclease family protein [Candidatus Bipolaricaulota bacterium]MDW8141412.1 bifunctional nuclease family protein [Candidatus Bipolaricaulota bacterium]